MPESSDLPDRQQLPVFVYGTLRAGQGNYARFLVGKTVRELPAILANHTLYVVAGLPCVAETLGAVQSRDVIGEMMYLRPDLYEGVLADLDRLEGYRLGDPSSHYVRVQRPVGYRDAGDHPQPIDAWVYLAGAPIRALLTDAYQVQSGDWVAYQGADSSKEP
jgi:gamma-glutamylcyclotransferase (GGCT)/AIG2-like uncharacterized protein YtfP